MQNIELAANAARKKFIGRMMVVFLGVMILLTFFSNTINNFSLPRVKVEQPASGALVKEINGKGIIEAKEPVEIFVDSESNKRVQEVKVKAGDKVKMGQELVLFEKQDVTEQLRELQISYERKKIALERKMEETAPGSFITQERSIEQASDKVEKGQKDLESKRKLFEAGAASMEEVKTLEKNLEDAARELSQKIQDLSIARENEEKRLRNVQRDIKDGQYDLQLQEIAIEKLKKDKDFVNVITAPFEGIVNAVTITKGTYINNSKSLCTLADTSKGFEFKASIDEENARYVTVGDLVDVSLKSLSGKRLRGKIVEITDSQVQKGEKKELRVEIPQDGISGGESGEIYVSKKTKFYDILVPNSAVVDEGENSYVYVLKEKKGPLGNEFYIQKAAVSTDDSDNLKTAILNGLSRNERVIVNSDKQIADGSRVMIEK